ncbi:unnamed protein product [Auanema sp. JU1783]|nr:unnamed protein product [Auanema sp. JU1783]
MQTIAAPRVPPRPSPRLNNVPNTSRPPPSFINRSVDKNKEPTGVLIHHVFKKPRTMVSGLPSYSSQLEDDHTSWCTMALWTDEYVKVLIEGTPKNVNSELELKFSTKICVQIDLKDSDGVILDRYRNDRLHEFLKTEHSSKFESIALASFNLKAKPTTNTLEVSVKMLHNSNNNGLVPDRPKPNNNQGSPSNPPRKPLFWRDFYELLGKQKGFINIHLGNDKAEEIIGPFKWRFVCKKTGNDYSLEGSYEFIYDEHNSSSWNLDCKIQLDQGEVKDLLITNKSKNGKIPTFQFKHFSNVECGKQISIVLSEIVEKLKDHPKTIIRHHQHRDHDVVVRSGREKFYIHSQILNIHSETLLRMAKPMPNQKRLIKELVLDEGGNAKAVYLFLLIMYNAANTVPEELVRSMYELSAKYDVAVAYHAARTSCSSN